jgi:hypothetical protein
MQSFLKKLPPYTLAEFDLTTHSYCLLDHDARAKCNIFIAKSRQTFFHNCPGGVAQGTSHPPQKQEDPGSNPARAKYF